MRKLFVPLIAAAALAAPSVAQADDNRVSLPNRVTTEADANAFTRAYVLRNTGRLVGQDLRDGRRDRRATVSDLATACLQHPVALSRFGCVFRFRVEIRDNDRRDNGRARVASRDPDGRDRDWDRRDRRRDRVQNLACLGGLRINGGPGSLPSAQVTFVDCVRDRDRR